MRKVLSCFYGLGGVLLLWAAFGAGAAEGPKPELVLLNWSDYMDPAVVEDFERQFDAKVKQVYYESDTARNELLLETEGRGYDVILVDGNSLRLLAKRGWLQPLSESDVPNLKHVSERWRKAQPESERFGVPYFWGTLGIGYRRDLVPEPITSWSQLFKPPEALHGKIGMINDSRDLVGMALKAGGYSVNSVDQAALADTEALLLAQRPFVRTYSYVSVSEASSMVSGEVVASMMFNGDAVMLQEHEENIAYVLPQEGGLLWVDYMTVTSNSRNKDLAKQFINFINEPSVAARLAEHVYYATPNDAAKAFLDEDYFSNPVIYPAGPALEKSEFHQPLPPRGEKRRNALFSRVIH